ncbi:MAG TPA: hypothetical protein VKE93_14655 [Candidatus Angelobacter sp.]|nr:hypothetical protein [Candidatus Angelobacter sp.]
MRWFGKLCFLVLVPGLVVAQTSTPTTGSTPATSVADELKALREAMAQQQQQIAQQQQRIDALQKQLDTKTAGTPHVEDATLRTNTPSDTVSAVASDTQQPEQAKESPLSFRIGGADFTPGGFVDFENVFRSTNTGNITATNFWTIPFSNTVQGHLTEYRATGQYSRFNIKTHTKFGSNDVTGYLEFDFNGNDAANVFVTSNPHTDRIRVYWLDLKRGQWEFLGGQSWGLLTPNRVGIGPMPSDKFLTIGEDAQVHVGVNYTRAGTFVAAWHPNPNFAWGVGVENPDQFAGQGEIIFPFAFNAQLGPQLDAANQNTVPNVAPDLVTKLAWDSDPSGRHFHFEIGGLASTVKVTNLPTFLGATFDHHAKMGGAVQTALNFELIPKKVRFVADGMWGNGDGRYLIGMAPQAVVLPNAAGNNVNVSLVHSGNALVGFEMQPGKNTQFGFYYGGMYAQRLFGCDTSSPVVGTCSGHPFIGFGGPNSPNSANRSVQEATIDWTQTFWRNPQYGALLLVTQASYVTRSPWFVAAGAPKNAHLTMGYVSLRYVLP